MSSVVVSKRPYVAPVLIKREKLGGITASKVS